MGDEVAIGSGRLRATVSPLGAELQTLEADGANLLWDGDPAFWTGRAPILFPIVGKLLGDTYQLDGREYHLPQHGFPRRRRFELVAHEEASVTFRLDADDETRAVYPFDVRVEVQVSVSGATLEIGATVTNRDSRDMPACFGFHPALRWPLPGSAAREDHLVRFAEPEPEPIRRLAGDGGLGLDPVMTPVVSDELRLRDDLFTGDAIVMDRVRSRSLRYGAPGGMGIEVAYPDMPMLGIWSKPGAGFVCIEPWQGHADDEGFAGTLWDKPGVVRIAPGEARRFSMLLTVLDRFD